jgi:aminobenzoyl-glutamate utilization protein B
MKFPSLFAAALSPLLLVPSLPAQATKAEVMQRIDADKATYDDLAMKIWGYAEVGYKEVKSSALLQDQLKKQGFTVYPGVADIPTAFIASYGNGHPIIAILGEFDALPGVSQEAVPEKKERVGVTAGHACGHHLFGVASAEAAIAVKDWMKATGQTGTIRFYGTPAEEGGSGKVYMVRAGLFKDVDVVLHWHPGDRNSVRMGSSLANVSAKFRFHGIAAHAAASPERGRSALDGVEAMDHMVNMMREHVPDSTRIHYVITRGGEAPNVVPAFAEVYYYVRSPQRETVLDVSERVIKAAQGAALGTGTTVDWEIIGGVYELLSNEVLGSVLQRNLETVGGVTYTTEEKLFAEKIGKSLFGQAPAVETAHLVAPWDPKPASSGGGSTDVGDVSWTVPTMGFSAATWVPGTPAHSWQAVAAGGTSIGLKGMNVAAKTLALTAIDLFTSPDTIAAARKEFEQRRGSDFTYKSLLGDRKPALNYRD